MKSVLFFKCPSHNVVCSVKHLLQSLLSRIKALLTKKLKWTCFVMVLVYGFASNVIRFVVPVTPSVPHHLFVVLKRNEPSTVVPAKEKFALFYHPTLKMDVIKQVKGVEGSRIRFDREGNLWVDTFCVGVPRTHSSKGEAVRPIEAGVIPKGYVFMYAPHEKSFDSRYAAFGLIPVEQIKGVGIAIL
jgi:conjugal transfer pilin signal peptidase TrbI